MYCENMDWFNPSFSRAIDNCSSVGWGPTQRDVGSPGSQWEIKKVIVRTTKITTPIMSSLLIK